ncbi:syntaxin-8 isoform X2 [Protopterus annectens]|uniref:syntaxin-8 isoform X2 n=1 Tax=Protopterus annectens TaxID=7888 RepID=UPI001CFBA10F|nr:syntaxin-8 isoform X2 [Protopterus annectens]
MAQDAWLTRYDASCRLAQEIAEKIHKRDQQQFKGGNSAKLNFTIRSSLQNLREQINLLRESLMRASSSRQITHMEASSRQQLMDSLLTREKQLQASLVTNPESNRYSLTSGRSGPDSSNPWLVEESEETLDLDFSGLRQQQQRIIEEQDAGIDILSTVIARQKQMGLDIGNELEEQSEIIDDLAHLVDKTDDKIRNETRHVKLVEKKSASCGMLVTIVLLLVVIVVVAVWPTS